MKRSSLALLALATAALPLACTQDWDALEPTGATAGAGGTATSGAAGSSAGKAGSAGTAGAAGKAGSAGTAGSTAGSAGTAGSTAGTAGSTAGTAGSTAGSAGSTAGSAGSTAGSAGDAGMAGAAGDAGMAGAGGDAGMAGAGGDAGMAGAGGDAGMAGAGGDAGMAGAGGSSGIPCTETGAVVDPGTGHCYFITGNPQSWNGARGTCMGLGAHLVTITSQAELDLVAPLVTGTTSAWIGLSGSNPTWTWVGMEPFSFTAWGPGQPNGTGMQCVRLDVMTKLWHDTQCNGSNLALCERE